MVANANAAMKANLDLLIIILLLADKFVPAANTCGQISRALSIVIYAHVNRQSCVKFW